MTLTRILYLLVCGIGSLNSLFLLVYAALQRRGDRVLNRLFALLLLTFSLRVSKAVWVFFISEVHPAFELLWMAAFLTMPLIWLAYVAWLTGETAGLGRRAVSAAAITAGVLTAASVFRLSLFMALVVASGVGIASGLRLAARYRKAPAPDRLAIRWLSALSAFVVGTWAVYAAYVLVRLRWRLQEDVAFNTEAVIFSIAVYALLFLEMRTHVLARVHDLRSRMSDERDALVLDRLRTVMERDRLFLDASLTLASLARAVKASPQQLSRALNTRLGASFTDYVNRLRVDEACRLLSRPDGPARKVGLLGYDCGFNSPSVFYAAFKRFTGRTPSEYLKQLAESQSS